MHFFFYGTLMDEDVRRVVLGREAPRDVEPASLDGWARVPLAAASYPVIVRRRGASVEGVLARALSPAARRRLARYEGGEYVMIETAVRLAASSPPVVAAVFVPRPGRVRPGAGTWELDDWRRRCKRRFLARLIATPRAARARN